MNLISHWWRRTPRHCHYHVMSVQYYKVLLQNDSVLQSTTPVLLCTTKYNSSTTLYYKVLLHYYSSITKYYSSTSLYYKVLFLIDPWRMKRHLQCAEQQESSSNFTKYCACHAKWISWLIRITYETSFTMRGATRVILQLHQILRLPRKMNLMIDPHHIWNVIYNARSNKSHPPTWPNTARATQNESHAEFSSHMKRYLQCAEKQVSSSNLTKYCACHETWISCWILFAHDTLFTMRGATYVTHQPHQILRPPQKMNLMLNSLRTWNAIYNARSNLCHPPTSPNTAPATKNDRRTSETNSVKTDETSFTMRDRSDHDPRISDHDPTMKTQTATRRAAEVIFALARSRFYWKLQRFPLRLSFQISPNAAPATKSDTWTSPNAAPATKSDTWTSPNAAPATTSDTWTSPNAAPATKSDTWTSPNAAPATKTDYYYYYYYCYYYYSY